MGAGDETDLVSADVLPPLPIPARGTAALACRCGAPLDLRPVPLTRRAWWIPHLPGDTRPIRSVGCFECATNRAW